MSLDLRVATCRQLPEPDADAAPLAQALAAAGIKAAWLAWDDPTVNWDEPVPTLLRSTWNYSESPREFLAWCARGASVAPLLNPLDVVETNVHKRYLLDLAARGVPTAPTTLWSQGAAPSEAELGNGRVVIKPAIGAGSRGARAFDLAEPTQRRAAAAHLTHWAHTGDVLLQPYVASVDDVGERSLVFLGGTLSHAIRKSPRFAGDDERVTGPHPIADDERDVALAALAPYADRLLYARVDLARDDHGAPMVMELELIEPSLFFTQGGPRSLSLFIQALRGML